MIYTVCFLLLAVPLCWSGFTVRSYASAIYFVVVCLSVMSVHHTPVLYRNYRTN